MPSATTPHEHTTTGTADLTSPKKDDQPMDAAQRHLLATVTPFRQEEYSAPSPARSSRATYTVGEVAALLGISRASVYTRLATGEIPARRIGSRWIIARHRFDVWLNEEPIDVLPTGTEAAK
jgi:excisionase family DNA binding protein